MIDGIWSTYGTYAGIIVALFYRHITICDAEIFQRFKDSRAIVN